MEELKREYRAAARLATFLAGRWNGRSAAMLKKANRDVSS
jgi:hypothetical protein